MKLAAIVAMASIAAGGLIAAGVLAYFGSKAQREGCAQTPQFQNCLVANIAFLIIFHYFIVGRRKEEQQDEFATLDNKGDELCSGRVYC